MRNILENERELIYFVVSVGFCGLFISCSIICLVLSFICNDLKDKVYEQQEIIEASTYEASRYKALYEEYFNTHQYCIDNGGEYTCQKKSVEQ